MSDVFEWIKKHKILTGILVFLLVLFIAGSIVRCNHVHAPSDPEWGEEKFADIVYKDNIYLVDGELDSAVGETVDVAQASIRGLGAAELSVGTLVAINPLTPDRIIVGEVTEIEKNEDGVVVQLNRKISSSDVFESYDIENSNDTIVVSGGNFYSASQTVSWNNKEVVYSAGLKAKETATAINTAELDQQLSPTFVDIRSRYDQGTEDLISALKAQVWAAGDGCVVRFYDTYINVIKDGSSKNSAYVIQAQDSSSSQKEAASINSVVFALTTEDGTSLAELTTTTSENTTTQTLRYPLLVDSLFVPIEPVEQVQLKGLPDDVCISLGISLAQIEDAVSKYCAVHLPTAHEGIWAEILTMDYKERTSLTSFTLDNNSNSTIKVTISWDDLNITVDK